MLVQPTRKILAEVLDIAARRVERALVKQAAAEDEAARAQTAFTSASHALARWDEANPDPQPTIPLEGETHV